MACLAASSRIKSNVGFKILLLVLLHKSSHKCLLEVRSGVTSRLRTDLSLWMFEYCLPRLHYFCFLRQLISWCNMCYLINNFILGKKMMAYCLYFASQCYMSLTEISMPLTIVKNINVFETSSGHVDTVYFHNRILPFSKGIA